MSYIGNPIVSTDFPVDYFSGNGSTTAFTLSIAPASVNSLDVQVSGVAQSPQTYTVSGTTLTFSAAPPTGSSNIVVRHLGIAGIPNTPSAASVGTSSIVDASVTQAKLASGVAGTGPAFSAYPNANTTLNTTTWTKINLQVEVFDTNNNFASSRFTPTVAGYYQLNGAISTDQPAGSALPAFYKNGVQTLKGAVVPANSSLGTNTVVSGVIYMNGTTDYVELYGYQSNGSAAQTYSNSVDTYFNGCLVRAA